MPQYYIPKEELERVWKEILEDIAAETYRQTRKDVRRRAYKTGRMYRATDYEVDADGFVVGTTVPYAPYQERKNFVYTERNVERALSKMFGSASGSLDE